MKKVYVIEFKDRYKIGVSKNPDKRLVQLNSGSVDAKLIYKSEYISNAYEVEAMAHKLLSKHLIGREWFSGISKREAIDVVKKCIELIGNINEPETSYMKDLMVYYNDERIPIEQAIDKIHREAEKMKIENDAIVDLLAMIAGNNSFSGIVNHLVNCNWSYVDIRDFLKTLL